MKPSLELASGLLALMILPGVASVGAAAPAEAATIPRCAATTPRTITTGSTAWVPAATTQGSWRCYLQLDTSGYNPATYRLQESLRAAEGQNIGVDGYYGAGTKQAVLNVQSRYGLTRDGEYGPNTGQAMRWRGANGTTGKWR